jgi:hypothetical protein
MLKGDIYAWLHIPQALEKDILEGKGGDVTGFTNTQMLLPGSIVSSSFQATVSTLSAGLNVRSRMQSGAMPEKAMTLFRSDKNRPPCPVQSPAQLHVFSFGSPLSHFSADFCPDGHGDGPGK